MDNELESPKLDMAVLQQKVNEFALAGAIKEIEDFYCSYNSPYRKAIIKQLEEKSLGVHFDLPDIMSVINEALEKEITRIANHAILNTYVPLVKEFLTRAPEKLSFSDILKKFHYEKMGEEHEYACSVEEDERWKWLNIELSYGKDKYRFTLHANDIGEKSKPNTYKLLSLPDTGRSVDFMALQCSGIDVKIPFTKDVLNDRFISFCASLIMSQTTIEMDVEDFYEEMFFEN